MDKRRRTHTRKQAARHRRILAASRVCWLCGHDGADAVDHKIPWDLRPDLADDPTNLAPAHHFQPCATCGVKCNRVKSNKVIAPVMRRTPGIVRPA